MIGLRPIPSLVPCVRSLAEYAGRRLVFNIGGWWVYYPAYESQVVYQQALGTLVRGALLALDAWATEQAVEISMDPFGGRWIEWLLSMWKWHPDEPLSSEWDPATVEYARLFQTGRIEPAYTGVCTTDHLEDALLFCADMVVRNLTPDSWIFCNSKKRISVYFHNTSSFGVCVPDAYDFVPLMEAADELGLVGQMTQCP